jgi:hypothetical protein
MEETKDYDYTSDDERRMAIWGGYPIPKGSGADEVEFVSRRPGNREEALAFLRKYYGFSRKQQKYIEEELGGDLLESVLSGLQYTHITKDKVTEG